MAILLRRKKVEPLVISTGRPTCSTCTLWLKQELPDALKGRDLRLCGNTPAYTPSNGSCGVHTPVKKGA